MSRILEKVERRIGEKLFLKGERCAGPKCAQIRRGSPPGMNKKGKRKGKKRSLSDYGLLLREKQKARFAYGLDNYEIEGYSNKAAKKGGIFGAQLFHLLESRLDTVVQRLGFSESRRAARQMVKHGHIKVNEKRVTIPSFRVRKDDRVTIREQSLVSPLFGALDIKLKKYEPPKWLSLDREKKQGVMTGAPDKENLFLNIDFSKIKEFYSR